MSTPLTRDEIIEAYEKLSIEPSYYDAYPDAIRIYLDVNGVVIPDFASPEEYENFEGTKMTVQTVNDNFGWDKTQNLMQKTAIWFNTEVVNRLAKLSRDPRVVIVWLTDWRISAPLALDEAMGIESLGYLDWQKKFTDYSQSFKGVAIKEEQELSPSKFVWVDDRANYPPRWEPGYFTTEISDELSDLIIDEENDTVNKTLETIEFEGALFRADIPLEQYLTVTTKNTVGLTMDELDLIEEWINENYGK